MGGNDYIAFTDAVGDGFKFVYDNTERLRITNTGNVGIGTATPASKLDVNGNTIVRGSVYFDGVSSSYIDNVSHDLQLKGAAGVSLWTHVSENNLVNLFLRTFNSFATSTFSSDFKSLSFENAVTTKDFLPRYLALS